MKTFQFIFGPLCRFILLAAVVATCATARGEATSLNVLPFLSELHSVVTNQLTIATNTHPADRKLGVALRRALGTIDQTKSNYAAGATSLGLLARDINHHGT